MLLASLDSVTPVPATSDLNCRSLPDFCANMPSSPVKLLAVFASPAPDAVDSISRAPVPLMLIAMPEPALIVAKITKLRGAVLLGH